MCKNKKKSQRKIKRPKLDEMWTIAVFSKIFQFMMDIIDYGLGTFRWD